MRVSGEGGGPAITAPVLASYLPPWHGQTKPTPWLKPTVQPACVHTALNARNSPAGSWTNHAGWPKSSRNSTPAPGATWAALAIARPAGDGCGDADDVACVDPLADGDGAAVVTGDADGFGSLLRARPTTAVTAASAPANAASTPAATPPRTSDRRAGSTSRAVRRRIHSSIDGPS